MLIGRLPARRDIPAPCAPWTVELLRAAIITVL
jgi:hypothetical protein